MTTTFARIPTVPEDDPRRSYDGFAPHPEVPIESTSILYAMEDDEFEWTQGWIDLYWAEVDETLRIREEELRSRRVGEKQKGTGEVSEGPEKKRLKVSNHYLLFDVTDCPSSTRTITSTTSHARPPVCDARRSPGLVLTSRGTRSRRLHALPVISTR